MQMYGRKVTDNSLLIGIYFQAYLMSWRDFLKVERILLPKILLAMIKEHLFYRILKFQNRTYALRKIINKVFRQIFLVKFFLKFFVKCGKTAKTSKKTKKINFQVFENSIVLRSSKYLKSFQC